MSIYRLENSIKNYSWGSNKVIANLLDLIFPSNIPQAELWMGTHPICPSNVLTGDGRYVLAEIIRKNPIDILGKEIFSRFGDKFPYLFKFLAINSPLSIQVHPDKRQAIFGYNKEKYGQKLHDFSMRDYKDSNCKLECFCALTYMWGLCGFRNIFEMQSLISRICPYILNEVFSLFLEQPNLFGLKKFIKNILSLSKKNINLAIFYALKKADKLKNYSIIFQFICDLADVYKNDISVFAPVILNLIRLEPGEAIIVSERMIHTYIKGVGVELMINSDNVLRAGLTFKQTNISEFFKIADFRHKPIRFVNIEYIQMNEIKYKLGINEFSLSTININLGQTYTASTKRSVEILFCIYGKGVIIEKTNNLMLNVKKGDSFLVSASVLYYLIKGNLIMYKAWIPI